MPDEKSLEARTDDDGHIVPAQNDEQRAADIDEQVRRAREGEVSVGGYDVEPGQYGPDAIARSATEVRPQDDGQSEAEAQARSEAIDAQVDAANSGAVGMQTGVLTAGPSGGAAPIKGSQLDKQGATVNEDNLDAATHAPDGRDLREDTQAQAVAEAKAEEAGDDLTQLTVAQLKALAKSRDIDLKGATKKDDIITAINIAE